MVQIIPAILATSVEQYQQDLAKIEQCKSLHGGWLHIDFADNTLVPNQTVTPAQVKKYQTTFHSEAHLMVQHPTTYLSDKNQFDREIIHVEADLVQDWLALSEDDNFERQSKIETGLAITYPTPLYWLDQYLMDIDSVLVMSVKPGFQGSPFIEGAVDRIKELVKLKKEQGLQFKIGVDGGINNQNIRQVAEAGADYVVVGSYLLKGDIDENLENLWEALQ